MENRNLNVTLPSFSTVDFHECFFKVKETKLHDEKLVSYCYKSCSCKFVVLYFVVLKYTYYYYYYEWSEEKLKILRYLYL